MLWKKQPNRGKIVFPMKRKAWIFLLSTALLSGCSTRKAGLVRLEMASPDYSPRTQEKEKVVLVTDGRSGQSFVAELIVDGTSQTFHATTPAEIHIETCVTIGTIRKTDGFGKISFTIKPAVENPTRSVGFGMLRGRGDQLQFGYHNGEVEVVR